MRDLILFLRPAGGRIVGRITRSCGANPRSIRLEPSGAGLRRAPGPASLAVATALAIPPVSGNRRTDTAPLSARPQKHSLTLRGHRTSVSLEPAFWRTLQGLAKARGLSVNRLASEIDEARRPGESLAAAIRVFCLEQAAGTPG